MGPFRRSAAVALVLLLLPSRPLRPIPRQPTLFRLTHARSAHSHHLRTILRVSIWWPREVLAVEPVSLMLVKCVATVAPTQASAPVVPSVIRFTPTTAMTPTLLHSGGSTLMCRRLGRVVVNRRSMPEASASPSAIATLIVPSLANDAMVYTRTTVDHRWQVVAECFVVFSVYICTGTNK